MQKTKKSIDTFLLTTASILLVLLTLATLWQVFTRFVIGNPSVVTEEIARFTLIWIALLGAAYGFGSDEHLSLDFIREKFQGKAYLRIRAAIDAVVLLFALFVLVIGGGILVSVTWSEVSPIMGLSMGAVYSIVPICGVFIIIYQVMNVLMRNSVKGEEQT
ncbi:TRAP transporter small permease [Salibacterium halotolerans]|uniref:TRAP-type C4-dicarboxylate transport system, small permease component n=1 Tax=Salibacterium halotolerans TaxID=1884432 RepID=A0A1I5X0X3_9BACI|nr:TRAP transporter small permease [Salibacterium halotolerans]SFQ25476.1 TRAP-type C4-dicarboxylate transport system, small permease component [Salibacterium halotolerans]